MNRRHKTLLAMVIALGVSPLKSGEHAVSFEQLQAQFRLRVRQLYAQTELRKRSGEELLEQIYAAAREVFAKHPELVRKRNEDWVRVGNDTFWCLHTNPI